MPARCASARSCFSASAMIGAATILSDPIFQGLAISLLFGLASSTLLTVLVILAIYIVLRDAGDIPGRPVEAMRDGTHVQVQEMTHA